MLAVVLDDSDLLGQHSQLLKVDKSAHMGLVAVVKEGQIFLDDGEEGDEWRRGGSLQLTILGHVVEW